MGYITPAMDQDSNNGEIRDTHPYSCSNVNQSNEQYVNLIYSFVLA